MSAQAAAALTDADGFVDTGDMVELRGDRYYFVGRRGGIINIGGLKVHPEEIEAVINRHPAVQDVAREIAHAARSPARSWSPTSILADGSDPAARRRSATRSWPIAARSSPRTRCPR